MRGSLLVILLLFSARSISAGFTDGNELYRWLQEAEKQGGSQWEAGLFYGYVGGVFDAGDGELFCKPAGVSRGQIAEIVKAYLRENPGSWHFPATILIMYALGRQFPCNK
ncbi:MAG: Rap1a/Tai family immunity protein [Caldilineaceae bacterium]